MPDTSSWALKAIEDAALKRAFEHVHRFQNETFTFMGFSPQQLALFVLAAERKGCRPSQTIDEIKEALKE